MSKFPGVGKTTHITTAATTSPEVEGGVLERIIINQTLTGTLKVYDHPSSATNIKLDFPVGLTAGMVIECGAYFDTGITIVTSAPDKVTVVTNN